jgi:hypothetical protein
MALLAVAGVSYAQPPDPPSQPPRAPDQYSRARYHFERGVVLINRNGDPAAALLEFRESSRLLPTFGAALNAVVCLKELSRYAEALQEVDALLARFPELTDGQRVNVDALRTSLLGSVGELELRLAQPGSSIVIDGVQRGTSPLAEPLRLDVGVHMLRVSKDGFQTIEQQVTISPRKRRVVELPQTQLVGIGMLVVQEQGGENLDVLIDGATVGRTPWKGSVSVGLHSLQLSGEGRGTAPIAVDVRLQRTATLNLRAVPLEAEALVEPVPPGSSVYVNGVFAGNGRWVGALPVGRHRFEVMAPGYLPFRSELSLASGKRAHVRALLRPDRAIQMKPLGLYLEPHVGVMFARSLRGGTDDACDCGSRSRPFGIVAGARVGYHLSDPFGVELGGGYLSMQEASTRRVLLESDPGAQVHAEELEDSVSLSGPFASLGVATRLLRRTPLTTRVSAGFALLSAESSNSATARGVVQGPNGETSEATGGFSVDEPSRRLLARLLTAEVRFGYSFGSSLSADAGLALTLIMPPSVLRDHRQGVVTGSDSHILGLLALEDEPLIRPFLVLAPSIAGRFDL